MFEFWKISRELTWGDPESSDLINASPAIRMALIIFCCFFAMPQNHIPEISALWQLLRTCRTI